MRGWQRHILIMLGVFGAMGLLTLVITGIGRMESRRPDGFVAKITPSRNYEVDVEGVETIYVNDRGQLFCVSLTAQKIFILDAASGVVQKQIALDKRFKYANQVAHGDRLYYLLDNTDIYVVDSERAELVKTFHDPKGRYCHRFAQVDNRGRLVTSNFITYISTIDLENGQVTAWTKIPLLRGVIVGEGVVYYWRQGFNVHALDPDTLEVVWRYVDDYNRGHANIAISGGALYYNDVYRTKVFDAKTGSLLHEFPLKASTMTIVGDRLFSADVNDTIACHDLKGELLWELSYDNNGIFTAGNYIYARSATNDTLSKFGQVDGIIAYEIGWKKGALCAVAQTERFDLIQDITGQVSLLDNTTGEELWRSERPSRDKLVPWVVYRGQLIISVGHNKIVSFNLDGAKR